MTNNLSSPAVGLIVAVAGLVAAFFLGRSVAEENYFQLTVLGALILCVVFSLSAASYVLPLAMLFAFATPLMAPGGINLDIIEQCTVMMIMVMLPRFWVKENVIRLPFHSLISYHAFIASVFLFCGYLLIHTWLARYMPYPGMDFSPKGIARVYLAVVVPFVLIALFSRRQFGINCPKNATRIVAKIIIFALLLNVGIRVATIVIAGPDVMKADSELTTVQGKALPYLINIPIIGLRENIFGLRVSGPLAVLVGGLLLLARPAYTSSRTALLIMALGLVGSALSGGRAALFISMGYTLLTIWLSRHRAVLFLGTGVVVAFFATMTIMPQEITTALPMTIQRSIVWFTPSLQDTAAGGSVTGSTNSRKRWFWNAIDAWQESPRAFWLGRSVASLSEEDIRSFQLYDEEGMLAFNVKRGTTHNLISNLLVGFGLVGCLLYYLVSLSLIWFLFDWLRITPPESEARPWIFAAAVSTSIYLAYASIGGGYLWAQNLIVILFGLVLYVRETKASIRASEASHSPAIAKDLKPGSRFYPI